MPNSVRFLCVRQLLYLGKNYPKCYSDCPPCLTLSVFSVSDSCCTWGRTTPSVTVTALSVPDSVRFLCVRQLLYLGKNYPKCYSDCSPCLTLSVFSVSDSCCTWGRTTPSVTVTTLSVPDSVRFLCVRQLLYLGKNYPKCYSDCSPCLTLSVFSVSDSCCTWGRTTRSVTVTALRA